MRKTVLLACLLLVLLVSVLFAPPPEKAEKVRIDSVTWDRDPAQFIVKLSCPFGTATAGEHANFTVRTELTIDAGGTIYTEKDESNIQKVEGASKDADGYVAIEPTKIAWDRQGFTGDAGVTTSLQLIGPSGKPMGEPVIDWRTVDINLCAWNPSPANGSTKDIDEVTPLSWSPGDFAFAHDVYFGTDENAVDNADVLDTTGIFRGRQFVTSYTPPEGVELGQTYYWRIDEVEDDHTTIHKGDVWRFTIAGAS